MAPKLAKRSRSEVPQRTSNLFFDDAAKGIFDAKPDRKVLAGVSLSPSFLSFEGFERLSADLEFQEWGDFLSCYENYNPTLLRLFAANLRPSDNSSEIYISLVNGKRIEFSMRSLNQYLFDLFDEEVDEPSAMEGAHLVLTNYRKYVPNYTFTSALQSLQDPLSRTPLSDSVVELSLENRLLHHIVSKTICPRSGTFTVVSDFDVAIMYFIRNRIKICLPYIMFNHFVRCARNPLFAIPYAMHLTGYLTRIASISSRTSELQVPTSLSNKYTTAALNLLFKKQGRTWVRKYPLAGGASSSSAPPPDQPVPESEEGVNPDPFFDHINVDMSEGPSNLDLQRQLHEFRAENLAQHEATRAYFDSQFTANRAANRAEYEDMMDQFRQMRGYWDRSS